MSQFRTLSPIFKEALENMSDSLKKSSKEQENGLEEIKSFSCKIISEWYNTLSKESQKQVDMLFKEMSDVGEKKIVEAMISEKSPSPFNYLSTLFEVQE